MKETTCLIKIFSLLFFCLFATSLYSADVPVAFNGIKLGSEIEAITNDPRFTCETTNSAIADKACHLTAKSLAGVTIADSPIISLVLYYFDDKLSTIVITFPEIYFKVVQNTLEQKYGPPGTHKVETYVSQSYKLFKGHVYLWENSVTMLDAVQYFSDTYQSAVVYKVGSQIDDLNRGN